MISNLKSLFGYEFFIWIFVSFLYFCFYKYRDIFNKYGLYFFFIFNISLKFWKKWCFYNFFIRFNYYVVEKNEMILIFFNNFKSKIYGILVYVY